MSRRRGFGPPDTERLYSLKVDNITYKTTVESLRRAFEKYGEIGDVYIPRDRYTQESRGFGFVRYYDERDADDAIDSMDGRMFDGRELRVQMAKHPRPSFGYSGSRYGGGRSRDSHRRYSRSRSKSRSRSRRRRSRTRSRSRSRHNRRSKDHDSRRSRSRSDSRRRPRSSHRDRSRSRERNDDHYDRHDDKNDRDQRENGNRESHDQPDD